MTLTPQAVAEVLAPLLVCCVLAVKMGPAKLKAILSEVLELHRAQLVEDVTKAVRGEVKSLVRAELAEPLQRVGAVEATVVQLRPLLAQAQRTKPEAA